LTLVCDLGAEVGGANCEATWGSGDAGREAGSACGTSGFPEDAVAGAPSACLAPLRASRADAVFDESGFRTGAVAVGMLTCHMPYGIAVNVEAGGS
jgi:hypothetical protein